MYTSNEMRTSCYLCVGYDQGCSFNGNTINNGNGDTVDEQISSFNKTILKYIDDIYTGMSILDKRIRKLKKRGLVVSDEQAPP